MRRLTRILLTVAGGSAVLLGAVAIGYAAVFPRMFAIFDPDLAGRSGVAAVVLGLALVIVARRLFPHEVSASRP